MKLCKTGDCKHEADADEETFEGYCEMCAAEVFGDNYKHDQYEEEWE